MGASKEKMSSTVLRLQVPEGKSSLNPNKIIRVPNSTKGVRNVENYLTNTISMEYDGHETSIEEIKTKMNLLAGEAQHDA